MHIRLSTFGYDKVEFDLLRVHGFDYAAIDVDHDDWQRLATADDARIEMTMPFLVWTGDHC